jgi:DtxR family transcriptional regulator, Mn-dependent transcriptional regulator
MAVEARAKQPSVRNRHMVEGQQPTEKEREYLEVIYYLAARREPIIAARLADWMKVQPPTVTDIVKRMEKKGYITRDKNAISLTERGHTLAEQMVKRHRLLERFLVDVMHVPWHAIHDEAVRLEHALSPLMQAKIEELVGASETCPHGNPIPGANRGYIGHVRLDRALVGAKWQLCRIMEEAEEDNELMRFMQSNDLVPGNVFTVHSSSPAFGVTLERADQRITVSPEIAAVVWGQIVE